jgi:hypothetical protein
LERENVQTKLDAASIFDFTARVPKRVRDAQCFRADESAGRAQANRRREIERAKTATDCNRASDADCDTAKSETVTHACAREQSGFLRDRNPGSSDEHLGHGECRTE